MFVKSRPSAFRKMHKDCFNLKTFFGFFFQTIVFLVCIKTSIQIRQHNGVLGSDDQSAVICNFFWRFLAWLLISRFMNFTTLLVCQSEWPRDKPFLLMHSRHARNFYNPKIKRIFEIAWTLFEIILFIHFYLLLFIGRSHKHVMNTVKSRAVDCLG